MIKRLIKLNLSGENKKLHILILIILASMITFIKLEIFSTQYLENFSMGDIIIEVFGGLSANHNLTTDIMSFILWIIPNIVIIYLIDIEITHKLRESASLVLPRVKSKLKWLIAFDLTIIITVIKYYLVLASSCLFVIFIKMGSSAFKNSNIITNNVNYLNVDINQYLVFIYIFILNVLTMIALVFFANNLYYIFFNSDEASIIGILLCIVSVNITNFNLLNKFTLMNQGMLKRHDMFKYGFKGFNIESSVFYLGVFLIINFFIGTFIISKRDLKNI